MTDENTKRLVKALLHGLPCGVMIGVMPKVFLTKTSSGAYAIKTGSSLHNDLLVEEAAEILLIELEWESVGPEPDTLGIWKID